MSLEWPLALGLLFARPAARARLREVDAAAGAAHGGARGAGICAERGRAAHAAATARAVRAVPRRADVAAVLHRPSAGEPERAGARGHRDSRARRFEQHARGRPKPTRLEASKAAAAAFIDRQPSTIRIGVVAFSDGSLVIQPPTKDRGMVKAAVKRLTPQGSTSLAQGIFASLKLIAGKPIVLPEQTAGADDPEGLDVDKVEIGFYGSAVVVLLSDGENTARRDPRQMAELASVAGVKVYPVGMGTREGTGSRSTASVLRPRSTRSRSRTSRRSRTGNTFARVTPPACRTCTTRSTSSGERAASEPR